MSKYNILRMTIALASACLLLALVGVNVNQSVEEDVREDYGTRVSYPFIAVNTDIVSDTVWDIEIGWTGYRYPYLVERNVTVEAGVTLTIDPGVTVKFNPGVHLSIAGTLMVNGGYFDHVSFLPYKEDPLAEHASGDWIGLRFLSGSQNSVLKYADVEYAAEGINCVASTSLTISHCTISHSYYYGIYCGEYTSPVIENCVIDTSRWAGIICDNRSNAIIENNAINTCMHGIVCYAPAEVHLNQISTCWVGITCWGDANITYNNIGGLCTDGIDVFHSDPLIMNNTIDNCLGNGTRFISSNATVLNNTFRSNRVGMDISYDAKGILDYMDGNSVNTIDVKNLYYVNRKDMVIEDLIINSGWPHYSGYLTAQGSVTLYDCENITFRDCTIKNSMNSIFATNSTMYLYNLTLENAEQAQLNLDDDSRAWSYNGSVDAESVLIGNVNCYFTSYDEMQVTVLNHTRIPIEGATVVIKEDLIELHNTTTDADGMTEKLVVKDKTVSESGIIASPLSIQAVAEGYHFDDNPREGVYVATNHTITFVDLGDIEPPTILSESIDHGDRSVGISRNITISFSETMDRSSTEDAFSISGNVTGTFSWSGFNLTFTPNQMLEYQTYYTVTIGEEAADISGNNLESSLSFSFTTVPKPETASWGLIAAAAVAIFAVMVITSWWVVKRMK